MTVRERKRHSVPWPTEICHFAEIKICKASVEGPFCWWMNPAKHLEFASHWVRDPLSYFFFSWLFRSFPIAFSNLEGKNRWSCNCRLQPFKNLFLYIFFSRCLQYLQKEGERTGSLYPGIRLLETLPHESLYISK